MCSFQYLATHDVLGDWSWCSGKRRATYGPLSARHRRCVRRSAGSQQGAAVMPDAALFAGHHRGHFRAEFFAGVLHATEVPDAVCQGVAIHPGGVAGGVAEFV